MEKPEYYIDLDGTLAKSYKWNNILDIGPPVPVMVERVKAMLANGESVVIFTARVAKEESIEDSEFNKEGYSQEQIVEAIENWCLEHIGQKLKITNEKRNVAWGYDDRFSQVIKNTGLTLDEHMEVILDEALWDADKNPGDAPRIVRDIFRKFYKLTSGEP